MTTSKPLPFSDDQIREIAAQYPTPFYLYDEQGIRQSARSLNQAFAWCPGFKEYFAVKATPNPYIVQICQQEGLGADCSSLAELELSQRIGLRGEDIMFTSNNTLAKEYKAAMDLGAVINLDDITHIDYMRESTGLPSLVCFRFNPGSAREGNVIIGKPEEAKYGFTETQLFEGYQRLKDLGVTRFGLHTMVASNELDGSFFVETARMVFDLAVRIYQQVGIRMEFVNLGGGIGIPYRPEQKPVDLASVGEGVRELYERLVVPAGLDPLNVLMENGRMITGPHGFLVTTAVHHKHIYRDYVGVDACMSNLMRPGMYGAYHHISVVGKQNAPHNTIVDVVGSLCENNDKFAINRPMPAVERGDLLVIHDAGAHSHAMGFQYNGKLRSAELLMQQDGSVKQIRRAETLDDYFATLNWAEFAQK